MIFSSIKMRVETDLLKAQIADTGEHSRGLVSFPITFLITTM